MQNRTLRVSSSAIPELLGAPALIPVKLTGTEGIDSLFEYQLTLKTPDALNALAVGAADFNLDDFVGRELTVFIELEGSGNFIAGAMGDAGLAGIGAGVREISGLITDAHFLREEGRHVFYQVTLRPWLHLATLTSDCKIFQDKTVVEVLDTVLADYGFPVDKRLIEDYPKRDYQVQFETDFNFISRLCQEWGISYFFEHSEGKHRLVLIDSMGAYKKNASTAYQTVNFYPPQHKVDEEYIHALVPKHQITSGQYSTRDYDYTRPKADLNMSRLDPRETAHNNLEIYQWHANAGGAHYTQPKAGPNQASNDVQNEGDKLALLRMQSLRTQGHRAEAEGNLRGMVAGCTFILGKHPKNAANAEYLILNTQFTIEEVAQESQVIDSLRGQNYRVTVVLTLHPTRGETYRPALTIGKPLTSIQTAVVVGEENQNIWTDELGRIKVQFPWDRYGQHNQHSSCWVRVSSPWAGNQLGGIHIPRIGQEVLIDFIGGDPDLPICIGRVHNQLNKPLWDLPGQAGLSGFRSRELTPNGGNAAAGRSNHLILDDTAENIQVQLKSDHQHSQLSLGDITRIEDNAGRKDPRGEGFELRTDGHGAIRAKDGLLITTEGRNNASAHITDLSETAARLQQAEDQHHSLGELAKQHQAQESETEQKAVAEVLKNQHDAIKGIKAEGGTDGGKFPELNSPHIVIASPAGIASTTPQSTHIHAGEHIALTSEEHTSLSVGKSLLASVAGGIRLFSQKLGMKLIAASADIEMTALKESINLLAKMDITLTANRIIIRAKEAVEIYADGSYTRWNSKGIESGTDKDWKVHAAEHNRTGPKGLSTRLPSKTEGKGNLDLFHGYVHGEVVKAGEFTVIDALGKKVTGVLDDQGKKSVSGLAAGPATVQFKGDSRNPWDPASDFKRPSNWEAEKTADGESNMMAMTTTAMTSLKTETAKFVSNPAKIMQSVEASRALAKGGATALVGMVKAESTQAMSGLAIGQAEKSLAPLVDSTKKLAIKKPKA